MAPCAARAEESPLTFSENDRVLVIAPHPDDESLGVGGILQSAAAAKASVKIAYLTNGESNEIAALFYQKRPLLLHSDFVKNGLTRKKEATDAMGLLGIAAQELFFLGYPDGGTLSIWLKYWGASKAYRSIFTHDRYYHGDDIVHDLEKLLLAESPTVVFVTAPFDLNSDHQAAYLYLQVALLDVEEQLKFSPRLFLYLVHAHQWPDPKQYAPEEHLQVPTRIDRKKEIHWHSFPLTKGQVEMKRTLILKYASQISYKKNFLLSFARANELYMDYPAERLIHENMEKDPIATFRDRSGSATDVVYRILGEELWVDVPLTNSLDEMGLLSFYVFSYRKGFLFSDMPKLTFKLFGNKVFVYDGFRSIYDSHLVYKLEKNHLFLRIPLSLLKDPDHLFVSTRNAKEEMSLDFGSWKLLEVVKNDIIKAL